jgi:hypothetical protein
MSAVARRAGVGVATLYCATTSNPPTTYEHAPSTHGCATTVIGERRGPGATGEMHCRKDRTIGIDGLGQAR